MRRAPFLFLAACDLERFNALRRRGHLTFSGSPNLDEGKLETGWGDFNIRDAFELRLTMDLMEAHGVGGEEARYIVGNAIRQHRFPVHPLNGAHLCPPYEGKEIWVFGGVLIDPTTEDDPDITPRFCDAGALSDLPEIVARFESERCPIRRLVAASATRAADFVRNRAVEFSIDGALDFIDAWQL